MALPSHQHRTQAEKFEYCTTQMARNFLKTNFAGSEEAVSLKKHHQDLKETTLKGNYFSSGSHIHSAVGLPQPEHTSVSMGSSPGVHPHDSHIFISFFKSTPKLIWQNCNLHLADKQGAKEAVPTIFSPLRRTKADIPEICLDGKVAYLV